jgi:hypothetical protein
MDSLSLGKPSFAETMTYWRNLLFTGVPGKELFSEVRIQSCEWEWSSRRLWDESWSGYGVSDHNILEHCIEIRQDRYRNSEALLLRLLL